MDTIFLGPPGTRIEFAGTVVSEKVYDTQWGNEHHIRFSCPDGAFLLWKSSKRILDLSVGDALTVRATIRGYRRLGDDTLAEVTNGHIVDDALALV